MNQKEAKIKPKLSLEEQKGLQDYWKIYEAHRAEMGTKLTRMAGRHSEFKVILQNSSPPSAEQQEANIQMQRRAIYQGVWKPYVTNLQNQGMLYARSGLSFHAWFEIVGAFRKYMVPYLLAAYSKSPKRLSAAIHGANAFFDFTMSVIGESYLETKQELIGQQAQRIQKGQSQLAGVINSAMDAIITIDEDQRILIFNPAAERMFQRFADKVIGQPLTMLIPERQRTKHVADVRAFGETSVTKRAMGRLGMVYGVRANGEEFPLEASISKGEVDGRKNFTAILRDISERTELEETLLENQQRFSIIFEKAPFAAALSKLPNGVLVNVNEAFERVFGFSKQDAMGRTSLELGINPDMDNRERIVADLQELGSVHELEQTLRIKSGDRRIFLVNMDLVEISGEKYILQTAEDITARKEAETALHRAHDDLEIQVRERTAALSESNMLLQMLLDYSPDHIFFKDLESRFIRASTSQARALGLSDATEMVGKSDFDFFAHAQRSYDDEQEVIRSGQPLSGLEEPVKWPDGRETWGLTTKVPLRDAGNNIVGTFGIYKDITHRKQAEEQVQKLNTDLQDRARQLEAANKELEAFSYSVSHDLRAPLRSIDGFSQALLEDYASQIPAEGQHYLERVRAAAQHMAALIDDILNLSRVARASVQPNLTDLSAIAQGVADVLQEQNPARDVKFNITPQLSASCDPHLLQVVLENLLNNAWKFTSKKDQARIEFNATNENGRQTFFVRDNGAGFDMKYADKLFGAFQRLHGASEFPGTGVGLATVQRIIHKHGGRIWAESVVDQGATFYFTL